MENESCLLACENCPAIGFAMERIAVAAGEIAVLDNRETQRRATSAKWSEELGEMSAQQALAVMFDGDGLPLGNAYGARDASERFASIGQQGEIQRRSLLDRGIEELKSKIENRVQHCNDGAPSRSWLTRRYVCTSTIKSADDGLPDNS